MADSDTHPQARRNDVPDGYAWPGNGRLRQFTREDDGGAVLTLFFFMAMILMAGLGIDTMRQEMERARLQATLDTAVLAGAGAPSGTEKTEIKAIVEDYFAKMDMADYLHEIDIDGQGDDDIETSLNATRVYAQASRTIDTHLMKLSGVETLSAAGASAAEVRTPKLEVSVVLDVSGSMYGSKLSNLKSAAKEFVTTLLSASEPGDTVISLVPFSWSATPPQTVFDALAVDKTHEYSTCLKFRDNDFSHATLTSGASALSGGLPVNQMIYTSVYGDFNDLDDTWRSCFTDAYMEFLPYSISEADLHAKIDALEAQGNTSGHQGMNWGAALLDPTFRQVSADLIASGEVDSRLSNVPADYDEPDTLKVVVVMTDGANTTSYFFDQSSPQYRGKHSDLFLLEYQEMEFQYGFTKYNVDRKYYDDWAESYCQYGWFECVYEATGDVVSAYYLRDGSQYYDVEADDWLSESELDAIRGSEGFISEEQLDWEKAWGLMSPRYYGEITGNWGAWNDYVGSESLSGSDKDARMRSVCGATKTQGTVIYSIGFEVSSGGRAEQVLTDCASSPNHYYPASGTDISAAFSSIASNVQNLRLTQ